MRASLLALPKYMYYYWLRSIRMVQIGIGIGIGIGRRRPPVMYERVGIGDGERPVSWRIVILVGPARLGIAYLELESKVRGGGREHPEPAVHLVSVQDLDEHLEVGRGEEVDKRRLVPHVHFGKARALPDVRTRIVEPEAHVEPVVLQASRRPRAGPGMGDVPRVGLREGVGACCGDTRRQQQSGEQGSTRTNVQHGYRSCRSARLPNWSRACDSHAQQREWIPPIRRARGATPHL